MEKELIFQILQIEQTNDEDAIRAAYRERLKGVNPEDDPEGFKRLRQAYEEALRLAAQPEEEEQENKPKTEVDFWVDRVDEFYQDVFSRTDEEGWKELFADPICEGLDTSLEAREKFIVFLLDHIHLPHNVWKLIDDQFEITANIEELREKFPINFLNYVKFYVENETFIPYELFQKRDGAYQKINSDKYIDEFLDIKKKVDNREMEGCLQRLDDMQAYHLYHPYEDVTRLRIFIFQEEFEKGISIAEKLLAEYGDYSYAALYSAHILWETGQKDRAYEIWTGILEKEPNYYWARYWAMRHLMDKKDYFNAREMLLELLEVNDRDEELRDLVRTANEALIEEFETTLREGREDERLPGDELKLRLAWCYLQNERTDEAEEILKSFQPQEKDEYEYVNLYSQLLYRMERFEEAVPYLKKRIEMICALTDDGTEKTRRRISRQSVTRAMLSYCYHRLEQEEDSLQEAEKAIDVAVDVGERLERMQYLANQLLNLKQYERAVDFCDRIIKEDEKYYPAYLIRQECCYNMKRAQQVVDDYHNAVNIYPGFYKPYLFAVKIFFYYGQHEDAKRVIDRARENQVELSAETKLYEAKVLRNLAHGRQDRERPMELLKEIQQELDKEDCDVEDKSEIPYEMGLLHWDDNEFESALAHMQEAITQNPERLQYRLIRGHVYLEMKKYEEALEEYQAAEPDYKERAELYYNRGCAYEGLNKEDLAEENFKKTLEINDTYRYANDKLYSIYRRRYNRRGNYSDYEQALAYINKQISIRETSSVLFHRAVLYDDAMETELSLQDYRKALEYDPDDSTTWSNMGFCYRAIGQFDKAIEHFQKAKELMKNKNDNPRPYFQMAKCYTALGEYEKALECCREGTEIFPDDGDFWEQIGNIYIRLEQYEKAIKAYEHMKPLTDAYYRNAASAWLKKGNTRKAVKIMEEGIRKVAEDKKADLYDDLADIYDDVLQYDKATECWEKAISMTKDDWTLFDYEQSVARVYFKMRNFDKAKEYAQKALDHLNRSGSSEKAYGEYTARSPVRSGILGWMYICLGDWERGEKIFQDMRRLKPCRYCEYMDKGCYESSLWLGILYEVMGKKEEAIKMLEETLTISPEFYAKNLLKKMRRKL